MKKAFNVDGSLGDIIILGANKPRGGGSGAEAVGPADPCLEEQASFQGAGFITAD